MYASVVNDRFDSEPKRHRFRAGVAIQLASALDVLLPLWPNGFLVVASVSNIGTVFQLFIVLMLEKERISRSSQVQPRGKAWFGLFDNSSM